MSKPEYRKRSASVTNALNQVPLNQQSRSSGDTTPNSRSVSPSEVKPLPAGKRRVKKDPYALPEFYYSKGFVDDLKTGRWMLVPKSSLLLMVIVVSLYGGIEILLQSGVLPSNFVNPLQYMLILQYKMPSGKYIKGWADFIFVFSYVIFWSFVRQFVTIHILTPLVRYLKVAPSKTMRFTEQGYAVFYMSIMSIINIYTMRELPTWWYKTEYFWLDYPQREIPFGLKLYYLLQASYWLQQTIILAGKIEKPRKDFKELVAHHMVTLWLIGWSYGTNLTYIGVSVFLTMDISDVFLALSKCINYVNESASQPVFAFFIFVWTYFRHYLNLLILWSVWYEFDLMPEKERDGFRPFEDHWMTWWMKYQIFAPILLLQVINLFWYFLIWRILYRAVFSKTLARDERSDDEDEDEVPTEKKVQKLKGAKAE